MVSAIAFVDFETTGLDPIDDRIIELGVIVVDADSLVEHTRRHLLVRTDVDVPEEVAAINGFDRARWDRDGVTQQRAALAVAQLVDGARLAGHNVSFDRAFLAELFTRHDITPRWSHRTIDTATLSWLVGTDGSLASLCAALGVTNREPHRAMSDCEATLECARIVRQRWQSMLAPPPLPIRRDTWRELVRRYRDVRRALRIAPAELLSALSLATLAPSGRRILAECVGIANMLLEKNMAYGDSALNPVRVLSRVDPVEQLRVRIDDKLSRLARGSAGGEDVIADLIGYLILLRIATK